jgi:hypothetical protein
MLEAARHEWHCFRDDEPGERFRNHHKRAHRSASKAVAVLRVVIGAVLVASGVVMLFIPGPGLLGILFGLALIAGELRPLAAALDRAEVRVRRWGRSARARWRRFRRKRAN